MLALMVSALLGAMGFMPPLLEPMVSLSVVLLGVMRVFSGPRMPVGLGIRRSLARHATWLVSSLGALCGGSGIYLFSQL